MHYENPYASPQPAPRLETRPLNPALRRKAMFSWQIPLCGSLFAGGFYALDKYIPLLGAAAVVPYAVGAVIGLVLSGYCLRSAFRYRRVAGPAIAGLILSALFIASFAAPLILYHQTVAGSSVP